MANTNDNNGAGLGKFGAAYMDTTDLFTATSGSEGTNGCTLDNTAAFTAGVTIYGRWNTVKLQTADSDGGIICYLAPLGS